MVHLFTILPLVSISNTIFACELYDDIDSFFTVVPLEISN